MEIEPNSNKETVPCVEIETILSKRKRVMFIIRNYIFNRYITPTDPKKDESRYNAYCIRRNQFGCGATSLVYRKGNRYFARLEFDTPNHNHGPENQEILKRRIDNEKRKDRKPRKKPQPKPTIEQNLEKLKEFDETPAVVLIPPFKRKKLPTIVPVSPSNTTSSNQFVPPTILSLSIGPRKEKLEATNDSMMAEFLDVGKILAGKLEKMDNEQRIFAEFLFAKVLMKGLRKQLKDVTDLANIYNSENSNIL